jgi:hypothetical protein
LRVRVLQGKNICRDPRTSTAKQKLQGKNTDCKARTCAVTEAGIRKSTRSRHFGLTWAHRITQIDRMWRAAICFSAALVLGLPAFSHAQYNDNDRQNPKEYTDEDSQPVAIMADILYPVGFAAEWLVARPLHYLTSDSPVSPVFRPVGGTDDTPLPPVPIIPDNTLGSVASVPTSPQDWTPTKVVPSTPQASAPGTVPPVSAYSAPPPRQAQMH